MKKNSILFVCDGPSPYRVNFFNSLNIKLDIFVNFFSVTTNERVEKWLNLDNVKFDFTVLSEKNCEDTVFTLKLIEIIKNNNFRKIIICNPTTLSSILAIIYMIYKRIDYYIEIDGAFYKKSLYKNIIKRFLFSNAIGCFSPNIPSDNYFLRNGVKEERIIRYPFSSVLDTDIELLSNEEKDREKIKNGFDKKLTILFVGSFSERKNVLKTAELLIQLNNFDFQAIFIGDGPLKEELKSITSTDRRFKILEHLDTDELKKFYIMSDVFLLLTKEDIWGLVINEAMSYGLYIITTKQCGAAYEMVRDCKNGYIVNNLTKNELENAISMYIDYKSFVIYANISIAKQYTIEQMVKAHVSVLNKIKKEKLNN